MAATFDSGPENAPIRFVLAHGAGAGITSPFLSTLADALADLGAAVTYVEFAYMGRMRTEGRRRPPPPIDRLIEEFANVLTSLSAKTVDGQRLIIGGKSLGGRVASHVATHSAIASRVAGLVCFGYPFHPPRKPEKLRTAHLADIVLPTLILQGERDPFGDKGFVADLGLPDAIALKWVDDGDHDFGPRGRSPATRKGNIAKAAAEAVAFAKRCPSPR